jgi:hypothetical protein
MCPASFEFSYSQELSSLSTDDVLMCSSLPTLSLQGRRLHHRIRIRRKQHHHPEHKTPLVAIDATKEYLGEHWNRFCA